jgi:hypothetical protein
MSASRTASSDGSLIAWNSPGTLIDNNSVLLNSNEFYTVEFRFATTTNGAARYNLGDAPVHLRDSATAVVTGNLLNARPGMFVNPVTADLHLLSSTTNAIDKASALATVTNDIDGDLRPKGARPDIGADEFTSFTAPVITSFTVSAANCALSFATLLGIGYDVQRQTNLGSTNWFMLVTNVAGTGGIVQVSDATPPLKPTQFYRVRLTP